jgi:hypothetical protein
MGENRTIIEEAVRLGLTLMDMETANRELLKLIVQVGGLENRNAALELGLAAVSRNCHWRGVGQCNLACEGRAFCNTNGLRPFGPAVPEGCQPLLEWPR